MIVIIIPIVVFCLLYGAITMRKTLLLTFIAGMIAGAFNILG